MTSFNIMTFNVRGAFPEEKKAWEWSNRREHNVATIKKYDPHIIGFQELQIPNLKTYKQELTDYDYVTGSATIHDVIEDYLMYNAVFWKRDRFEKVDTGHFCLSETPDTWSQGWDAMFIRFATWIILRDKQTQQEIFYVNTHLDHVGEQARVEGSKVIVQQIEQLNTTQRPAIVTADFNSRAWAPPNEDDIVYPEMVKREYLPPANTAHKIYTDAGFRDSYIESGSEEGIDTNTYHAYHGSKFPPCALRIDWILIRNGNGNNLTSQSCQIIRDSKKNVYPSDHYPVLAELTL